MELNKLIRIPVYLKIIQFFHENPNCIDTPRGVAAWTGESKAEVKKNLAKLARLKILTAHKVTSTTGYCYTRDPKLIKKINGILEKIGKEL